MRSNIFLAQCPRPVFSKIITVSVTAMLLAAGCKNGTTENRTTSSTTETGINKTVVPRDNSINTGNAYNDIFLDSGDVGNFIAQAKLDDQLSAAMRNFYNARNFEYSWFTSTGLTEQAFSFHSLCCTDNEKDVFSKSLEKRLDKLRVPDDSVVAIDPKDATTIKTELEITEKFIQYAIENYKDNNVSAADLGTYIPAKKTAILDFADAILADNSKNRKYDAANESYRLLKEPLRKYTALAKSGGWPVITADQKKYTLGASGPEIATIKKRLQLTGELATTDTSDSFDEALQAAVKTYQQAHGYKPTGEVTPPLIKDMNVTALASVQQLIISTLR